MAVKQRKKRPVKAKKNPLMMFMVFVILLAILSVGIAYFVLNYTEEEQSVSSETTEVSHQEEEDPIITIEPMYTGTWVSNYDGAMLTLDRFSFTLEMPSVDNQVEIKGELAVVKNVLTFVYTSGSATCRGEEGHYQFALEDNGDIFFNLIKDNCKSRKERMTMSWFRL